MTQNGPVSSERVAEMRREFDEAFARPPVAEPPATEPLLRITAAGTGFFVRLRDISSVRPCGVIVPVPGARRALLGLSAIRGQILPLYSLSSLLDLPGPASPPRWILVVAGSAGAGIGVDRVDGVARIPETAVREASVPRPGGGRGSLSSPTGSRELLDLASVVETIRRTSSPEKQER